MAPAGCVHLNRKGADTFSGAGPSKNPVAVGAVSNHRHYRDPQCRASRLGLERHQHCDRCQLDARKAPGGIAGDNPVMMRQSAREKSEARFPSATRF